MSAIFSDESTVAIEHELEQYFLVALDSSKKVSPSYERLWNSLYELMKSGGKRFRPKITLLAYELFGGTKTENITPIAAAQELLHFSLLIHDDIIDRDYIRHSVPNIAGRYMVFYQKHLTTEQELVHFSHSAALLGGDLMLAGAYQLVAKSNLPDEQKQIAHDQLSKGLFDVAGGELLDTETSFLPYTPGDALNIALYKTAGYSFVTPLLTGAKLAHIMPGQEEYLTEYAEAIGIAYQLVDDLLGVFGDEDVTGKSVLGDIREGKQTFLIEKSMEGMSTEDKILFNQAFANPHATREAVHQVKELLVTTGGKQRTEDAIAFYRKKAHDAVAKLQLDAQSEEKLIELARTVIERDA